MTDLLAFGAGVAVGLLAVPMLIHLLDYSRRRR